jgi:hypothetical protein
MRTLSSSAASRTGVAVRRISAVCATLTALIASQQVSAGGNHPPGVDDLKGTYAFTLAESCVQQVNFDTPGFDNSFTILDSNGAMTYGGASNGLMVFDGRGKVSFQQAAATNIFNADSSYSALPPPPGSPPGTKPQDHSFLTQGKVPLGFGFGPALQFACTGSYTVGTGKLPAISLAVTCTASLPKTQIMPDTFITGFSSTFNMHGILPEDVSHLSLTDLGTPTPPQQGPQSVTIMLQNSAGQSLSPLNAQRVCTRSTTADLVSQSTNLDLESK